MATPAVRTRTMAFSGDKLLTQVERVVLSDARCRTDRVESWRQRAVQRHTQRLLDTLSAAAAAAAWTTQLLTSLLANRDTADVV